MTARFAPIILSKQSVVTDRKMTMSQKPAFDPAAVWQKMISRWEQEVNDWSGKLTQNEQFGKVMSQATKMQIMAQRSFNDHMEKLLKSLNLPSKTEIEEISERLDRIEEVLERLTLTLGHAQENPVAAPKRPRKPAAPEE